MDIKNKKYRLLGFYNKPNQSMKEEGEYVEEAKELATLFQKTLSSLLASKDMDPLFASIIKSNAVIILKDEDKNLYAYWTLKRTVRISDVKYVKSAITEIPRKYKSWFTPGEEISLEKDTRDYVITTSGQNFLITFNEKTLPLNWDNDYISIEDLSKLLHSKYTYLEEYDTDEDCEHCDGYDYSYCDMSRCRGNCDGCGGRRYICNNSCINHRYDKGLRLQTKLEEIEGAEKGVKDILEKLNTPHCPEPEKLYEENEDKIVEFVNLYDFLYKTGVTSEMIDTMKLHGYFKSLAEDRQKHKINKELVTIMVGSELHTLSYDDLKIHESGLFRIDYSLGTVKHDYVIYPRTLGVYDSSEDSYVTLHYMLKFTDKKQRKQFLEDFKEKRVLKIKLSKDKKDQYLLHYINK